MMEKVLDTSFRKRNLNQGVLMTRSWFPWTIETVNNNNKQKTTRYRQFDLVLYWLLCQKWRSWSNGGEKKELLSWWWEKNYYIYVVGETRFVYYWTYNVRYIMYDKWEKKVQEIVRLDVGIVNQFLAHINYNYNVIEIPIYIIVNYYIYIYIMWIYLHVLLKYTQYSLLTMIPTTVLVETLRLS